MAALNVTPSHLSRLVQNAGGEINDYGVILAFPPQATDAAFDVELSQISRCIVDDERRRVTLYPTSEGDMPPDPAPIVTISDLIARASSLLDDRSNYSIHMFRRLASTEPLRGAGEATVRATLVLDAEREVWLLPTDDDEWAIRAAAP
ncbi:MAG: hypothetical protein MUE84_05455 [Hyphomonas sp.]|nr:hypothetical protein [Hyphomonas sp.]